MTVWTYVGATVREGDIIADLPLTNVKFGQVLNGRGQLSATLKLGGFTEAKRAAVLDATDPVRRAIYAYADGHLVWGGPIWPRRGADALSVTAGEWGSYYDTVLLRADKTYTQVDQLAIARDLITSHQALGPGFNVRVALGAETSGVLRDRTYLAGNVLVLGELLSNLANVSGGFDFAWPVELDEAGRPRGRLLLGSPTLGSTTPGLTIELPRSYSFDEDGTAFATDSWALGANVNGSVQIATTHDETLIEAGYPVVDKVKSYSTVTDTATLQGHADADQQAAGGVLTAIPVTVGMSEVLGTGAHVGDQVTVRLDGPRFPGTTSVLGATTTTTIVEGGDVFSDIFSDIFGGSTQEITVSTPGQVVTTGGGFEAVMRIAAIDYNPAADTCDLTLAPRITLGGRIPTSEDMTARVGRLTREVRQLAVAT